jgi:FMN reductase
MTPRSAVIVGNPKLQSRTLDAALRLHLAVTGTSPDLVVEVATLGADLLGFGNPSVVAMVEAVQASSFAIFACPTYKASYTGLLKLFLDQFPGGEGLRGVTAIPLMLGAGPAHALAPELLLKPVLVELGATTPSPGLYLSDSTYASDGAIEAYVERWGVVLQATRETRLGE